ncbi:hypothetical protein [Bradyrhizobium valentinum]|nr:hypothetical protein [Bradyrhizobium valentinum]
MSLAGAGFIGKLALVIGSSSDARLAREFARLGAHVAVDCRSNFEAAQ